MPIKSNFHEMQMHSRLDELYLNRQTVIAWEELYLWYGVRKVSARTYRDLLRCWNAYLVGVGLEPDAFPVEVSFKRQQGIYSAIFRTKLDESGHADLTELARL